MLPSHLTSPCSPLAVCTTKQPGVKGPSIRGGVGFWGGGGPGERSVFHDCMATNKRQLAFEVLAPW